jgi:hypothetical protein
MPVKAIPHPTDEGKWMSNFDEYGHGEGNGKSRGAIYKHFRNLQKVEAETNDEKSDDFVSTDWLDTDSNKKVKSKTIPEPLSKMSDGKMKEINLKAQGHVIRAMFVGLDRLVTHWGRGVMSNPDWSIDRSSEDYDTLQDSTISMLEYYDIQIPVTPPMIWAVTVGSAYAPQISHVVKNRDKSRKRKGLIKRMFSRKPKEPILEGDEDES